MSAVRQLLGDPISKHMRRDPARVCVNLTVGETLEAIRKQESMGRIIYFYVVDEDNKLVGVIPTRRLLRSKTDTPIADILIKPVQSIPVSATVLEACEFFILHRLLAFPIVDADGKLVGQVDVDLYTDEVEDLELRQAGADLFQLVGVYLSDAEQKKSLLAAWKRIPWLMCNVVGGMIAALISDAYTIATHILVTPFIALVTGMAEGVSMQSVSISLQAMHGQKLTWPRLVQQVLRETFVGLLLGVICGLIVGVAVYAWKQNIGAAISLCFGIAGGITGSAAIGMALPFLLRLLKRDPQVASGPIALVSADMVTLVLYFTLAGWLLK